MRYPQFDWVVAEADRHRRMARLLESPALKAAEHAADQYRRMADQAARLLESPALKAAEHAADQYRRMADQAARLLESPALKAAEHAADQYRRADQARLLESPALKAAEHAADQYRRMADQAVQLLESPALKAAEHAADQYHQMAGQAAQLLESPALKAAEQAADQYHRMADQAARLLESPALKAAEQAADQYRQMADQAAQLLESPALKAAEHAADQYRRIADQAAVQLDFLDHSRLLEQFEQAHQAANKLLAKMPQLTPELFGGAWNESVAEAVRRLERTEAPAEDLDGDADEDAATVQKAAPPEAQARVKVRLCWLRVRRGLVRLEKLCSRLVLIWTLLGEPVPDVSTTAQLLGVTAPPSGPPVPAPDPSTTRALGPVTTALTLPADWAVEGLPAIVERAGPTAAERVVEFFTAQIRNGNTRAAYAKAVTQFFDWCDKHDLELDQISAVEVAAYVEDLEGVYRAPTIKQHLAAIRRLFDWLAVGQVISWNPTAAVRGPTHVVKRGKTPVLQPTEVRLLLDSIDTSTVGGLRDRALLGVMIYSFARVSAVVNMDVDDYYQQGKRCWLRLREKGGKHRALPVHHKAEAYLDAYLESAGIATERGSPLWRSLTRTRELGERRMSRVDVFRMVKRRVKPVALGNAANCHTFRASGITAYLLNGGTLERAQAIAGHESARTTQVYDRPADDIAVEDVERIKI